MQRENGIAIGIVTDLKDPDALGRVRVKFPTFADQQSTWAKIVSPMAGKNRGFFFRPEVDDEVLVAWEMGDPRRPYVLGALWSKQDPPPADDGNAEKNNWRFFQSRSGHIVKCDDTQGAERFEIIDADKKLTIVVDTANNKIQLVCNSGDLEIKAPSGTVTIDARTIEFKASADATLQATGTTTVKGATVNIN